ncbi:hypothetical protein [Chitinophaga skermanii]|nr:hypothetical protein [Chitinophaga skermanii]
MKQHDAFSERSRLFTPILFLLFLPIFILLVVLLIKFMYNGDKVDIIALSLAILLQLAVFALLLIYRLSVLVDEDGVHFTYPPHVRKLRTIPWEDIDYVQVVEFNALGDFLGWGYKRSPKYGQGYLTQGNAGLFVVKKDGTTFMLSILNTQKLQEILHALEK